MTVSKKSFAHSAGVSNAIQHIRQLKPTPTMSALEVAYMQGKEARRRGRPDAENPHADKPTPNDGKLAAEWARGYGDTRK
jgi:hypothetical protein